MLLPPEEIPDDWRDRACHVALVPLLPEEMAAVLLGRSAAPALDERDERIAALLTRGASLNEIGRAVALSARGVQHRIDRLRERFGARSKAELVAHLARHGIGMEQTRNDSPQEDLRRRTKAQEEQDGQGSEGART